MGNYPGNGPQLSWEETKQKILEGGRLAIERLIAQKRRDGGYIVISQDGKVVKLKAEDLKP